MKKIYTFGLVAALMSATAVTAQAAKPFVKGDPATIARSMKKAKAASRSLEVQHLVSEDFSKFTAGSETEPAAEMIEFEDRYHIPDAMTAEPGWTGGGLYSAGGAVCLKKYTVTRTDYDGSQYNEDLQGYITTPAFDLGGTTTVTFRAKRLGDAETTLWVVPCDAEYGPYYDDQQDYILTDQWQEYTLVATHADFGSYTTVQFMTVDGEVLLDDIKMDFVRDRIPAPYAYAAKNLSETSFIASWEDTGAPSYKLNVYSQVKPETVVSGEITENFDGDVAEGWTIKLGDDAYITDADKISSAPRGILFNELSDTVVSPKTPEFIDDFTFFCKPSGTIDEDEYMSLLKIEIHHFLTDTWEIIAHIPYSYLEDEQTGKYGINYKFAEGGVFGHDVDQIRMSVIQKGKVDFYVDDIKIHYTSIGKFKEIVKDKILTETEFTVDNSNTADNYYYMVQGIDGDLVSELSNEVWVDAISGLKVKALPATDINAAGFTANWEPLGHATDYKVDVYTQITAKQDMKDVVIITEDFNAITEGTVENPGTTWKSPLDFGAEGMASTGWSATQPAWANGMAGTTGTNYWMGTAGLVLSPVLDLTCTKGGVINVEATVVTTVADFANNSGETEKEGIFAMVMTSIWDQQAITAGLAEAEQVGENKVKIQIPVPADAAMNNVMVAFMNKSGTPFFVDDVKIMVDLKAGQSVGAPFCSKTAKNETSCTIGGINPTVDYSYAVTASTVNYFTPYSSETSEPVVVKTSEASIKEITTEAAGNGAVYDLQGRRLSAPVRGINITTDGRKFLVR